MCGDAVPALVPTLLPCLVLLSSCWPVWFSLLPHLYVVGPPPLSGGGGVRPTSMWLTLTVCAAVRARFSSGCPNAFIHSSLCFMYTHNLHAGPPPCLGTGQCCPSSQTGHGDRARHVRVTQIASHQGRPEARHEGDTHVYVLWVQMGWLMCIISQMAIGGVRRTRLRGACDARRRSPSAK